MSDHALLSPSAAHRWLNCTAAARLEMNVPDSGSDYAMEGTLAHCICARKLKEYLGKSAKAERAEIDALRDRYYAGEMEEYTDEYVSAVVATYETVKKKTPDCVLAVERRLDFAHYIPQSFGTADAIIAGDDILHVFDFKYGKGVPVSAKDNPQLKIYALGAIDELGFSFRTRDVVIHIIQPRLSNNSDDYFTVDELQDWARRTLIPKAREAYSYQGTTAPGEWCRFCRVKASCRALKEYADETMNQHTDARLIDDETLATDVLPRLDVIRSWLADIDAYALERALGGHTLPGYKIVEGRSNRKITDPVGVETALSKAGYAASDYLRPRELKSITDLEKLTGKKLFAETCGAFIEKPTGKPTLVPVTDKRPVFSSAASDFKDFVE